MNTTTNTPPFHGNEDLIEDATEISITFTDRMVTDGGMVSYTMRLNGGMIGTILGWRGMWSSAYAVDGKHTTMRAMAVAMLARVWGS